MSEEEAGENVTHQDQKLNRLVQEAIYQPISAESNPFFNKTLIYLSPYLHFSNPQYNFGDGVPPHLPYMLAIGDKRKHPDALVYCRPENRRTGIVTSTSGITLDETPLNYLDEKGLGQLLEEFTESSPIRRQYVKVFATSAGKLNGKPVTWGGTDLEYALHDAKSCDGLMQDGLRIVPTVAIVQLDKIPDESGIFVSIEEAIQKGLLAEDSKPAIQFRAYVTPYRPKEFIYTGDYHLPEKELQRKRLMFTEALDDMSKDKSIPIDFSQKEYLIPAYLDWFADIFGQSLARLHKAGKVHNWLHEMHNVTLDVRIVDSDGLEENATEREIYNERGSLFSQYRDSHSDLWKYYESIKNLFSLSTDSDELLTRTVQSYEKELHTELI